MDINPDQSKLMSSVEWNKRDDPEVVLTNFHVLGEQATLRARENTKCLIDVSYGPSGRAKYDVYGTDLPDDAPILLFLHGGYWQRQSITKDNSAFAAETCVSAGIKFICIDHELCPDVMLNEIVLQVKSVTHQILEDAANSRSRGVWISGHCAGGYLALALLDPGWLKDEPNSSFLKGLISFGGIFFLEPLITSRFNVMLKLDSDEAKRISNLSVEFKAAVQNLSVMVAVAEYDSPEFIRQARELTGKLCSSVDDVDYVFVRDEIDHFSMVENLVDKDFSLTKRLINHINFRSA